MRSRRYRWTPVLVFMAAGTVRAMDPTPGFGASVRVGYGSPMGSISSGPRDGLGATFAAQVPLQLDVGYRVTPELALAVFGQYALAATAPGTGCVQQGVSCSARGFRAGIEALWHFLPGEKVDPWVAAGIGWEWATLAADGPGGTLDVAYGGMEYANAQAGADFPLTPSFSIGPWAQLTVASYSTATVSGAGGSATFDVPNARVHQWLQLGVRGTFGL